MTEAEQAQLGLSALRPHPGKIRQNPLFSEFMRKTLFWERTAMDDS